MPQAQNVVSSFFFCPEIDSLEGLGRMKASPVIIYLNSAATSISLVSAFFYSITLATSASFISLNVFSVSVLSLRFFVSIYLFLRVCLLIISLSFSIFSASVIPSRLFICCCSSMVSRCTTTYWCSAAPSPFIMFPKPLSSTYLVSSCGSNY